MTAIAMPRQPHSEFLDRLRTVQLGLGARGAVGVGMARQRGSSAASSLLTGLVAYYQLGEASGNAVDAHTSGLDLTAVGAPGSGAGKVGNARTFGGSADAFERASWTSFSAAAAASVMFWLNSPISATTGTVLSLWTPTPAFLVYRLNNNTPGTRQMRVFCGGGTSYATTLTDVLQPSTWYHVAIIYDGSLADNANRLKLYINNSQQTLSYSGTIPATLPVASNYFEIGRVNRGGNYFSGTLDDLGVWSKAVATDEIAAHYNSGNGKTHPF